MAFFSVDGFCADSQDSQNLRLTKVGEWGSGEYVAVSVQGNYAYIVTSGTGLDIVDISDISNPVKVGNYDIPGSASGIYASGNYAYVADGEDGLLIIDVSDPLSSTLKGNYKKSGTSMQGVVVSGNYAYVWGAETTGTTVTGRGLLLVIDVSNPSSPALEVEDFTFPGISDVCVSGSYAYIAYATGLKILDISTPSSLLPVGSFSGQGALTLVYASGNYVYATSCIPGTEFDDYNFCIIDVSDPSSPGLLGTQLFKVIDFMNNILVKGHYAYIFYDGDLDIYDISDPANMKKAWSYSNLHNLHATDSSFVNDNNLLITKGDTGLEILDVTDPTEPSQVATYDISLEMVGVFVVKDNYAYIYDIFSGLKIVDISNPSAPVLAGTFATNSVVDDMCVNGHYLYVAGGTGLQVIDISNPVSPALTGKYDPPKYWYPRSMSVNYPYAYVIDYTGLMIFDVSSPSSPSLAGQLSLADLRDVFTNGNYAYVTVYQTGLKIIDVSNPSSPNVVGSYNTSGSPENVIVSGNYAYVTANDDGLHIIDVNDPSSPRGWATFPTPGSPLDIYLQGDFVYVAYLEDILRIFDVSVPFLCAWYEYDDYSFAKPGVYAQNDYVYLTHRTKFIILKFDTSYTLPVINMNRSQLIFASDSSGTATPPQSFFISNSGDGTLNWSASGNKNWLNCSPTSGTGSGEVIVSVDSTGLTPGTYNGTITISDPNATNSPQTVTVTLNVYSSGQTSFPFGDFATPIHGSTVRSSVPFTGWVLDDIGVQCVQLFREENGSLVYIGDAVFVEGARPDVEQAYPGYPMNYKAGWGYMMLTNFLPNGGNGTFNIHALATDMEGNQVTLGVKTIICDNANAVKPFGAIDTPTQGGTASGNQFINWGWVLTPQPNSIPTDGSTINVWVDGVNIGHPTYNNYRPDIAGLFPDYANSNGAVGYFYLDTTTYENGVHTIQWTATDNAGNTDGIGSRYFTIQNTGGSSRMAVLSVQCSVLSEEVFRIHVDASKPIGIKKGCKPEGIFQEFYPDNKGVITIEVMELERMEIHLGDIESEVEERFNRVFPKANLTLNTKHLTQKNALSRLYSGYQVLGHTLKPLPIGTTFDSERGVFCWQPGVGFVGEYRFVFIATDHAGNQARRTIVVNIKPRFSK